MAPKKKLKLTPRQAKLLKARAEGKTYAEAAIAAGYSPKHAGKSGHQALSGLRGRVQNIMEDSGLDDKSLIGKYLLPALEAKETQFFQKDGKVTDKRTTVAWGPRLTALKEAFLLNGSYAPRDPKEAAQFGVKIIIADIPGPPGEFDQFADMIPPELNVGRNGNKKKE